ncbi:MAG: site-specific integrase [Ktedonobacterales bacterium]
MAQRDYEQNQFIADTRQTVEQYLTSWLEARRPFIKEHTWEGYEAMIPLHVVPVIGKVKLAQLTAQHVQQVVTATHDEGLSTRTVAEAYSVLHRALRAAERLGIVPQAASTRVQRPRIKRREMRPLSREEAQGFLEAARGHWLEALFRLALSTGMRRGELLALKWRDVDLDAGRLSVVASLRWRHGVAMYSTPKTKRSRRQIALTAEMVSTLVEMRRQQRAQRLRVGPAWQGEAYDAVFSDELGERLREKRVLLNFRRVLATAGILTTVRFHDLRHTCATLLLQQRVHPKVVSEMLGHSSITITLDLYSHVLPDMQDEAARAMATALGW